MKVNPLFIFWYMISCATVGWFAGHQFGAAGFALVIPSIFVLLAAYKILDND